MENNEETQPKVENHKTFNCFKIIFNLTFLRKFRQPVETIHLCKETSCLHLMARYQILL